MSIKPIILVGMPRSGSTLLTRLLNESSELFVVNDFYFLQYVESVNGFDSKLSPELAKDIGQDLVKRIRARVERPNSPPLECALQMSPDQEKELESFAIAEAVNEEHSWNSLLSVVMEKAGQLLGKPVWGYNTPQDYLYLERIFTTFPEAKVIFLLRDPRDMVRSYKHVTGNGYHDPNRYHPALQTLAWRTSVRHYWTEQEKERQVLLVRYEDLVHNTNSTLEEIANFTGITIPNIDLANFGNNSSFSTQKPKSSLRESEIWLCEKVGSQEMKILGYENSQSKLRLEDLGYLSILTLRAFWFYFLQSISSSDRRKRVLNTMLGVFRSKESVKA